MKNFFQHIIIGLVLLCCSGSITAQQGNDVTTRILFIYDASNSMNKQWESGTKHSVAFDLISQVLDSIQNTENLELALRVFGHRYDYRQEQVCEDSKLEVTFGKNRTAAIQKKLKEVQPKGTTPIALSLEKAGGDFPDNCSNCRNIIILITDGIEECDGDPCAVSRALSKKGITLKPFIIGIGLDEGFAESFKCVGNYFDAANEQVFQDVLGIVISQAMNSTTMQLNMLDDSQRPEETNIPFMFFDQYSGMEELTGIHTMNGAGNPDTMFLDPAAKYNLKSFTVPAVEKDSITLTPGKHNIVAVNAGQGVLNLKRAGAIQNRQPQAIVRKSGEMKTLNVQKLGTKHRYLTGTYDLEVLTLPRTYIEQVDISQSHTTSIELPPPGMVTVIKNTSGYGSIFVHEGNEVKWVCHLKESGSNESIRLQPGKYQIVFRPRTSYDTKYTRVEEFTIKAGESKVINLKR